MPIEVIDEIVPKNDGKFALMQAKHIEMPNGSRLSEFGIAYPTVNGTTVTLPLVDDKFFSLEPETFYVFGTVDSMPVFCNDPGDGRAHEFAFEFTPSEHFTGMEFAEGQSPQWANFLHFSPGKPCQVSIVRGIGVCISVL